MNMVAEVNSSRWLSNENYDGEMWKDIPSYEGLYEASNMGRIKSKERYSDNYYVREGKLIRVFPSIREVKRILSGTGWKTICDACSGKSHSAIGFQWRYIKEGEEPTADIGPICRRCSTAPKAVYQYTLGGVFVRRYESITEAGLAVGIASTNISACVKGKQKSAAGFLWSDKILNT